MGDPFTSAGISVVGAAANAVLGYANAKFQLWQGCEDNARLLVERQTTIRAYLQGEAANSRQGSAAAVIRTLLDQLKEVDDDTEDLLSIIATDEAMWRNKKVRELKLKLSTTNAGEIVQLLDRIKEITGRIMLFKSPQGESSGGNPVYDFCPPRKPSPNDHPNTNNKIVGREDDIKRVLDMVLATRVPPIIVSITGEIGVGKTTLAQEVYNHKDCVQGRERFSFRFWIPVAHELDYKWILKEILRKHSGIRNYDTNDLSEDQLLIRVVEFLSSYHFLLVLDGVGVDACGSLKKLTDLIIQRCWKATILVTSRSRSGQSVEELMKIENTHLLNPLDEEQTWELFKQPMIGQENLSQQFIDVGKSIVSSCSRLPLLVKAVGGLLSCYNDLGKWNEIDGKCKEGEIKLCVPRVQRILDMCSDHLPPHLNKCFAFCQIFPKSHRFDKTELLKLWISSSLIHHDQSGSTIDEIANRHFDQLLRMCFFRQDKTEDDDKFQMLDLTQESPQTLSKSYFCQVKDTRENRTNVGSRYVSLLCEDVEGASSTIIQNSKKLRALLLPRQGHKPFGKSSLEEIFLNLKCMRTLDLSWNALVELPGSVSELKLLHYLDLSNNDMKELPNSICSLLNLQTLKLLGCPWLLQLPRDLSNLTKLENLELDDDTFWSKSPLLPPYMRKLVRLKNLHAFQISRNTGCGVDELRGLSRLTGTLHISKLENAGSAPDQAHLINNKENLNVLVLEWSDINNEESSLGRDTQAEGVLRSLKPHSNLQVLKIIGYRGTCSPSPYESWMQDGHLTNLVSLSLNKCLKCKLLSLGELVKKLKELEIVGMSELEEWTDRRQHSSLQRLTIRDCPKLTQLPTCNFSSMSFFRVENCASLRTLPVSRSIRTLVLVNNPVLHDVPHNTEEIATPSSEIKIINCPNLSGLRLRFPPKNLELSGCHSELPGSLLITNYSKNLRHLSLDRFHVEELWAIPNTSELRYLIISKISGLTRLPTLPSLGGLKALYIHHCPDLVSLSDEQDPQFQGLVSLKILSVWDNAQLEKLPGLPASITCLSIGKCPKLCSLGETMSGLTALKDLQLTACPSLQSLPQGGLPGSLVHLHVEGCQKLSEQCWEDGGSEWEKIRRIPDREIVDALEDPEEEKASSSKPFYRRFICCTGTSTR